MTMGGRELVFRSMDATGLNGIAFRNTRSLLRVLCYHGAWVTEAPHFGNYVFIGRETFRSRLARLAELRCNVLPLPVALEALREDRLPERAVAITIDDGWASTFDFMLPELEKHNYPAMVYLQTEKLLSGDPVHDVAINYAVSTTECKRVVLPTSFVAAAPVAEKDRRSFDLGDSKDCYDLWAVLCGLMEAAPPGSRTELLIEIFELLRVEWKEIIRNRQFHLATPATVKAGISAEFAAGLHTHSHSLGDFSRDRVIGEIRENRASLAGLLGTPDSDLTHFCWPGGKYTANACEELPALGIDSATTCDYGLVPTNYTPASIPRILDGEQMSEAEFVARLSGLCTWLSK
jgi:peptidoglycan/xylan/chitin deacetylase (PgdA/CDA1 family)